MKLNTHAEKGAFTPFFFYFFYADFNSYVWDCDNNLKSFFKKIY